MSLFRKEVLGNAEDRLHGEVVFSQPTSVRIFAGVLFVILAIAAIWVTIGTYARVETVPGILVTSKPSAKVMARQPGLVASLAVVEGQRVEKGDPLLVVDTEREAAIGGDVAARSLGALEMRRKLSEAQVAMANSRAAAETTRLSAVISSAQATVASLQEQIAMQKRVVQSNQDIFDRIAQVVERGFVSKIEFERRRQTLLSSQQSLAGLEQRLSTSLAEIDQANAQLSSVRVEAAQGVSRIQEELQSLAAEQARLQGEQSYVINAPISGRVTALSIAEGRQAGVNLPMMVIVPDEAELSAELFAPTRAVGFVEKGKEARLLYDAFPYQRFGSFEGAITSISRTAVDPRDTEIPFPFEEPVYRIKVRLDQQTVEAFGEQTPLQAGMTLQANIILERQNFAAWLLQPLSAVLNRNS